MYGRKSILSDERYEKNTSKNSKISNSHNQNIHKRIQQLQNENKQLTKQVEQHQSSVQELKDMASTSERSRKRKHNQISKDSFTDLNSS